MNPSFSSFEFRSGILYQDETTEVHGLTDPRTFYVNEGTAFVFVKRGQVWHGGDARLRRGMYGCASHGQFMVDTDTEAVAIVAKHYDGMRVFGGPVENRGRLRYIDGCTDSLLIPPVKKGDPCLNLLHFPTCIDQTMHTHPSVRVGVVFRGYGECVTPWGDCPLRPGSIFVIHPSNGKELDGYPIGSHKFRTTGSDMSIVAYHPDSDVGPTDELHPMLSRTIVDGKPATELPELWTR
jgi:hypothetical protein